MPEDLVERRHNMMRKIQALLDRASNTPYEEEADSARAKADELMTIYTIETWEIDRLKPKGQREEVTSRFVNVCSGDHVAKDGLMRLVSAVGVHCRCRMLHYDFNTTYRPYQVKLFGFPSDLDYAELLWTNLLMQVTREMKPEYNESQTFEENLARFKEAGMKWAEMHKLLKPHLPWAPGAEFTRQIGVRYTGIYTKFCKDHGRKRMYTSPMVFVRSFVDGFALKVDERMSELRRRQREVENAHGPGTGLALIDRKKEVDDFYNGIKKGGTIKLSDKKVDYTAFGSGQRAGARADLGQSRIDSKKEIT